MKKEKDVDQSLGEFKDFSYTPKKGKGRGGKTHPRYYIYIKNASLVNNPNFPLKANDPVLIELKNGKLIISKVKITIQKV